MARSSKSRISVFQAEGSGASPERAAKFVLNRRTGSWYSPVVAEERKKPCPPPLVRDVAGRCVPRGFVTPLGGPGSGLWPSGQGGAFAAVQQPSNCLRASISADCFEGCDPSGATCGWLILSPPGTVTFTGTNVLLGPFGADKQGVIGKLGLGPIPIRNVTVRYTLTEVAVPEDANKSYVIGLFDAAANQVIAIGLIGDGTAVVFVGNGDGTGSQYFGAWTPISGATRIIQGSVDAAGTPSLTIDGVAISLTFFGAGNISFLPNAIGASIENDDLNGQGAMDNIFATVGNVPLTMSFCCP